jgi:type VI protein secretion system component VasF
MSRALDILIPCVLAAMLVTAFIGLAYSLDAEQQRASQPCAITITVTP